jgi:hypothetical protein
VHVVVPAQFRQNVIAGLVVYVWAVFGLAKTCSAFAVGKALPMVGAVVSPRALGGLTMLPFAIMLIVALLPFRKATSGANPAGRALVRSWLLEGGRLFLVLGVVAAGVETLFLVAALPVLRTGLGPEARGTIGIALAMLLYAGAGWIAYRWAKRRIDAR